MLHPSKDAKRCYIHLRSKIFCINKSPPLDFIWFEFDLISQITSSWVASLLSKSFNWSGETFILSWRRKNCQNPSFYHFLCVWSKQDGVSLKDLNFWYQSVDGFVFIWHHHEMSIEIGQTVDIQNITTSVNFVLIHCELFIPLAFSDAPDSNWKCGCW